MKKVLVISVHPDDETLMAGGTILKYKVQGYNVSIVIITSITEEFGWAKEKIDLRAMEINRMAKSFEIDNLFQLNFPTTMLDTIPMIELVSKISNIIFEVRPEIVILPYRNDVHSDHKRAFEAAYSCTKSFRYPFIRKIMMGETLSETEFAPLINGEIFTPNSFVDVSEFFARKLEIMQIYQTEVMSENLPRSINAIKSLGAYRGSRIGVAYAEAFQILFERI